jgi:pimeloyl-ACP methyl ester carboxylesterase
VPGDGKDRLCAWRVVSWLICCCSLMAAVPSTPAAVIPVDGQNLYVEVIGKTGPVIVFEAGLGNDISTWRLVAPAVSRFARVVLYNRAGLGRSLPWVRPDAPVTAEEVATSLRSLLMKVDLPPPYILVGHSLGGLYAQMFARRYPRDVAGVVLLDAASPDAPPELKPDLGWSRGRRPIGRRRGWRRAMKKSAEPVRSLTCLLRSSPQPTTGLFFDPGSRY